MVKSCEDCHIVYLYYCPDCRRKWLAYLRPGVDSDRATLQVWVEGETGQKAKNNAITWANKGFPKDGVSAVMAFNFTDKLWGINNFSKLKEIIKKRF